MTTFAIKLDDGGAILYVQERTATFGDRFRIYKFRSMVEDIEAIYEKYFVFVCVNTNYGNKNNRSSR